MSVVTISFNSYSYLPTWPFLCFPLRISHYECADTSSKGAGGTWTAGGVESFPLPKTGSKCLF